MKYQVGEIVEGKIERTTPFGAFVDIGGTTEALLHVSELPEDVDPYIELDDFLPVGTEGLFKVIGTQTERNRVSLSMRGMPEESP